MFNSVWNRVLRSLEIRLPDSLSVRVGFLRVHGQLPALRCPRTFSEKIAWRKLHQHDPRFVLWTDKARVKNVVAEKIGAQHVVPTLWEGERPEEIPYATLEPPYVIKTNQRSGKNLFVRMREEVRPEAFTAHLRSVLQARYVDIFREWAYEQIPPRILVERMLKEPGCEVPRDYKCFVFRGRVLWIQVDGDRFCEHRRAFFDRFWNRVAVRITYPEIEGNPPAPPELEQMIALAETLAEPFDFVRMDFYNTPEGIFFGEATFYPVGGVGVFNPPEWDRVFGEAWKLPA